MATLKQRLHRKNAAGSYDVIYLETSATIVKRADGVTSVEDSLSAIEAWDPLRYEVKEDGSITSPFVPQLDAKTLEGHPASYFATASGMQECFQSVSEGKALVAAAVTDKGVSTAADATFATMAGNIANIVTGPSAVEAKVIDDCTVQSSGNYAMFSIPTADIEDGYLYLFSAYYQIDSYRYQNLYAAMYSNNTFNRAWARMSFKTTSMDLVHVDLGDYSYGYKSHATNGNRTEIKFDPGFSTSITFGPVYPICIRIKNHVYLEG